MNYLPLAPAFFGILIGLFVILFLLLLLGTLRYAYERLGLSPSAALWLLAASLIGSYFNFPVVQLPPQSVVSGQVINFFGIQYMVPYVAQWPGTVVAVNIGGAVIPTLMSIYLLVRFRLWAKGAIAVAVVTAVCYWVATPVPGLGIAMPVFMPALTTALVALVLSRSDSAPLAYIGGSLGTLIGADLLNLGSIQGLGAPVASIGGAGTFDGIFLIGILAVLLASLTGRRGEAPPAHQAAA
jgi:uncharacterized membrane protein